jgi:hypothetical protein
MKRPGGHATPEDIRVHPWLSEPLDQLIGSSPARFPERR